MKRNMKKVKYLQKRKRRKTERKKKWKGKESCRDSGKGVGVEQKETGPPTSQISPTITVLPTITLLHLPIVQRCKKILIFCGVSESQPKAPYIPELVLSMVHITFGKS